MAPSGSTPIRYLTFTFRADHRRAIDRYIDYFGDQAAPTAEPRNRSMEEAGNESRGS